MAQDLGRARLRIVALAAVTAAGALVLSACSSSGSGGSSSAPASDSASSSASSSASGGLVADAAANVETWYANNTAPIDTSAFVANNLTGKKILYVSAGLSSPSGTEAKKSMDAMSAKLGFDYTAFDGQFTASKYQEGIRQAISGKYDGLIVYGIDCPGNEAPFKEVKAAGIPIIGVASVDCDEVKAGAESLFTADALYNVGDTGANSYDYFYDLGVSQADYIIAKTNGEAKVIAFDVPDFVVTAQTGKGFRDELAKCTTCTLLETVNVGVADFGPALAQKADQALLKHPDANAIQVDYDDLVTLGISNSIVQSGRNDEILAVAGGGLEATMDYIRKNKGLDAGYGYDYGWEQYAGVATLINVLGGKDAPVAGQPIIYYDADHNVPATGPWVPGVDFSAAFYQAWGV